MARPTLKATPAQRRDVRLMKADGFSDERIAAQLGISRTTLLKHFAAELEFGADTVRRDALRNLKKASDKGSVAASNALLRLVSVVPPASTPEPRPEPPEKLGKKELADRAAMTAEEGTSWKDLLN